MIFIETPMYYTNIIVYAGIRIDDNIEKANSVINNLKYILSICNSKFEERQGIENFFFFQGAEFRHEFLNSDDTEADNKYIGIGESQVRELFHVELENETDDHLYYESQLSKDFQTAPKLDLNFGNLEPDEYEIKLMSALKLATEEQLKFNETFSKNNSENKL